MKVKDIISELDISNDIDKRKKEYVEAKLKERKREIEKTELILKRMKEDYRDLLKSDLDKIYYDECW